MSSDIEGTLRQLRETIKMCISDEKSCAVKKNYVNDYQYRVRMPAMVGSFAADLNLTQANSNLSKAQEELRQIPPRVEDHAQDGKMHPTRYKDNPAYAAKQAQIAQLTQVLSSLQATYPAELRKAICIQEIETPGRQRCKEANGAEDPGCLDYRAIQQWESKVVTK